LQRRKKKNIFFILPDNEVDHAIAKVANTVEQDDWFSLTLQSYHTSILIILFHLANKNIFFPPCHFHFFAVRKYD
jgi:hypothetical protein